MILRYLLTSSGVNRELKRLVRSTPTLSMLQVCTEAIRWEQEGRQSGNGRGHLDALFLSVHSRFGTLLAVV
ncbi:hypothetical protein MHYP_G00053140 [Metynnis hypsauchen]